tara:strand:+ start:5989 stop:6399 length:411 start_codon:yes stop_codon:yes gene_type:complete
MSEKDFKFLSLTAETWSLIYGAFLILWGFTISSISNSSSMTSYIPTFIGLPILVFSFLSIYFPERKKLFMHIAVVFILLAALGGLDFIRSLSSPFESLWGDLSKLMLLLSGSFFTFINVKSFIHVRKMREAESQPE